MWDADDDFVERPVEDQEQLAAELAATSADRGLNYLRHLNVRHGFKERAAR